MYAACMVHAHQYYPAVNILLRRVIPPVLNLILQYIDQQKSIYATYIAVKSSSILLRALQLSLVPDNMEPVIVIPGSNKSVTANNSMEEPKITANYSGIYTNCTPLNELDLADVFTRMDIGNTEFWGGCERSLEIIFHYILHYILRCTVSFAFQLCLLVMSCFKAGLFTSHLGVFTNHIHLLVSFQCCMWHCDHKQCCKWQ